MLHSVFISYSRRESPFVDVLLDALEDEGVEVWVDYHSLIPAKPWLDQILEGIRQADVFLLIVSKDSMSSENVRSEYQVALDQKKRIILIIFEAVSLPASLQTFEWIDMRSSFNKRVKELLSLLDQPIQQSVVPQKGFRTYSIVWLTFVLSLLLAVISIPAWWTFYVPALLIPLPFQILKRGFPFYRVRFAVLTLPLILIINWGFFATYRQMFTGIAGAAVSSLLICPIMILLLSTKGMRLWGKPGASAPRSAKPYRSAVRQPQAVPFFIEYAPEDKKYADAIIKELTSYGHSQMRSLADAQACFVVISRYKNRTSIDPEKQTLYPIIVQDTALPDQNLQRIQWIDFRRGLRNLNSLALLLPEPAKLLNALGVVPLSGQGVYPRVIQIWDYFLALLAIFSLSIWLPLLVDFGRQFVQLDNYLIFFTVNILITLLTLRIISVSRRSLLNRQGRFASLGGLIGSILLTGFFFLIQSIYVINVIIAAAALAGPVPGDDVRGAVVLFLPFTYLLGLILIAIISLWNWRDFTRWFPAK
jgi:hypothetical protein